MRGGPTKSSMWRVWQAQAVNEERPVTDATDPGMMDGHKTLDSILTWDTFENKHS